MRMLQLSLAFVFAATLLALPASASAQDGPEVAQGGEEAAPRRRRRRRRRPPQQRPPEPEPEASPEPGEAPESNAADVTAAAEAGAADAGEDVQTVGSLRRSNNLEFDARLVRGQRAGAGAVVLFNRAVDGVTADSVQTDNRAGGHTVAELLVRTGHRRIAFINGLERASTNRDRLSGFAERLAELGAAPPIQEYGEYTFEGGREAAKRLMMRTEAPDAIFVANDISALGALEGLRRDLGIRVPETVSVVGFDDIPMASWPSFDLTTVRQRRNRMIAIAMDRIDAILAGTDGEPERELVEGRLIMRGSVRLSVRADLTTA
ncbi:MAG: substrate-binding domain-containing protein [Myxococcota bacterium]